MTECVGAVTDGLRSPVRQTSRERTCQRLDVQRTASAAQRLPSSSQSHLSKPCSSTSHPQRATYFLTHLLTVLSYYA